ncbi:MAG: hypothetical protein K8T25_18970 [Planctomycetia bacterium]|nr:hypothetical protein [Planctomycetia bacterium]
MWNFSELQVRAQAGYFSGTPRDNSVSHCRSVVAMSENPYRAPNESTELPAASAEKDNDLDPQSAKLAKIKRACAASFRAGLFVNVGAVLMACIFLFDSPSPGHRVKPGFMAVGFFVLSAIIGAVSLPRIIAALWHGKWTWGLAVTMVSISSMPLFLALSVFFCRLRGITIGWD